MCRFSKYLSTSTGVFLHRVASGLPKLSVRAIPGLLGISLEVWRTSSLAANLGEDFGISDRKPQRLWGWCEKIPKISQEICCFSEIFVCFFFLMEMFQRTCCTHSAFAAKSSKQKVFLAEIQRVQRGKQVLCARISMQSEDHLHR